MNRMLFSQKLILLSLTVKLVVFAGAPEATENDRSRDRGAAYARDPAKDFDTLDDAGNDSPKGIWSDGTTMWVTDSSDDKIFAYDMTTKARVPAKDFNTLKAAGNDSPRGIWSDSATMWVADTGRAAVTGGDKIYAYDMTTKARVPAKDFNTLKAAGNDSPRGIWSDGATMWVADTGRALDTDDDKIYAYDMTTKARVPAKDFNTLEAAGNDSPRGIWSDGATMWVADTDRDRIMAYNLSTKVRDPAKDFNTLKAAGNTAPQGLWSDGATMWVADDHWDGKLYAYNMPSNGPTPDADDPGAPSAGGPTDFNDDGKTDFVDFFLFIDAFGGSDPRFDLDGSGTVDFVDFFLFVDAFDPSSQAKLVALAQEMLGLPSRTELQQNAPNPFNSETVISWFLPEPGPVRLEVFSLTGQRVAVLHQGPQEAGRHRLHWDGRDEEGRPLASGIYLYRLVTEENVLTRKLTLLR